MKWLENFKNLLMPEIMEEEEFEEKEDVRDVAGLRQAVNGASSVAAPAPPVMNFERPAAVRPTLSVCPNPVEELSVAIYVPTAFAQVRKIADNLVAKKAAIVNYEQVEGLEQRRICDFINGVCYILDGEARRISEAMVLYVPAGVNVITAKVSPAKKSGSRPK